MFYSLRFLFILVCSASVSLDFTVLDKCYSIIIIITLLSFVRSFVLCGQGSSLLWTQALRPYSGPVRLPRERKGIGRCVWCMLASVG